MDIKHLTTGSPARPDAPAAGAGTRNSKIPGGERDTLQPATGYDESISLTTAARVMSAAQEGSQTAPFDSQRVAEIRQALDEGRYQIDNRQLADRMISFESQLTGSGR